MRLDATTGLHMTSRASATNQALGIQVNEKILPTLGPRSYSLYTYININANIDIDININRYKYEYIYVYIYLLYVYLSLTCVYIYILSLYMYIHIRHRAVWLLRETQTTVPQAHPQSANKGARDNPQKPKAKPWI